MTKITKKVQKEVDELDHYECDGCGKKSTEDLFHTDLGEIKIAFGFGSEHDMETYSGHLCDSCFAQLHAILPHLAKHEVI